MADELCDQMSGSRQRVLLVGTGDTGIEVARRLRQGWDLTLLDLDVEPARKLLAGDGGAETIRFEQGDSTSRLVLERAGVAGSDLVIVTTAADEVTLETCRVLVRDFQVPKVLALVRRTENMARFEPLAVDLVQDFEAVAGAVISRLTRGSRTASNVGLGSGEIFETEILPNSSVIGKPLSQLSPQKWLVAAIYREGSLVVPHGSTQLRAGDRVLLVGEPRVLPCIARYLRTGHSEFPLHYGTGIAVPLRADGAVPISELEYLLENTRAEFLEFISQEMAGEHVSSTRKHFEDRQVAVRFATTRHPAASPLGPILSGRDVGIVAVPPENVGRAIRLGLKRSPLAGRIEGLGVPVLVARGTHPYKSILHVVTGPVSDTETATLAIDVARMLDAPLTVAAALPPAFVAGPGFAEMLDATLEETRELAASYNVRVELKRITGNPVRAVLKEAAGFSLMVLGLPPRIRTSLLNPGVELNLIHGASCSVLVLPRQVS